MMSVTEELKKRMDASIANLQRELSGLRTGRASAHLVDGVKVEVYGSLMPITQVATVNVPEARLITLQVWDKTNVAAVEKAIRNANLGLNPSVDGQLIRLPIPDLTEERRKEIVKIASGNLEHAKVAIRNIRRDGMDALKKEEKDGKISQDESRSLSEKVQAVTDEFIKKADQLYAEKEKEIMKV
jgi:ribosome recycling factor